MSPVSLYLFSVATEYLKFRMWLTFPLGSAIPDHTYATTDAGSLWALTLWTPVTDSPRNRGQHHWHRRTWAKRSKNQIGALEASELIGDRRLVQPTTKNSFWTKTRMSTTFLFETQTGIHLNLGSPSNVVLSPGRQWAVFLPLGQSQQRRSGALVSKDRAVSFPTLLLREMLLTDPT